MTVDIHRRTWHDALSLPELELYHDIMDYRASRGLAAVPLSAALTTTAGRHVLDTRENIWPEDRDHADLHDWSDARYHGSRGSPEAMREAPARLRTGYLSDGHEISAAGYEDGDDALRGWQDSDGHDALLANTGSWEDARWRAIGVGLETSDGPGIFAGRIFHVWFGEERDDAGPPKIRGTGETDQIRATRFADRVFGRDGDDAINGGGGADRLSGGGGADRLHGGGGGDSFVFARAAESGASRPDRIDDFDPVRDRIDLAGLDARRGMPGDQAFDLVGPGPLGPGDLRYARGELTADLDRDGRADFAVRLDDAPRLTADDFLL